MVIYDTFYIARPTSGRIAEELDAEAAWLESEIADFEAEAERLGLSEEDLAVNPAAVAHWNDIQNRVQDLTRRTDEFLADEPKQNGLASELSPEIGLSIPGEYKSGDERTYHEEPRLLSVNGGCRYYTHWY